jgi:SAM-dependent methyltransferase
MRKYVTNLMFMLNGAGTIEEKSRDLQTSISLLANATGSSFFASDCLITWAKSMGFLEDQRFVDCVNRRLTGERRNDEAMKGIVWRLHTLCWAAKQAKNLDGDFVEAGCYAGNTARVIAEYVGLALESGKKRKYWLYDLFENDGSVSEVLAAHSETLYEHVKQTFVDMPEVVVIRGEAPKSFSQGAPKKIAFLHVDMNNAPSERAVLEELYDRVVPGGVIVFDDYGWVQYRAQKDSADAFMASRGKTILELPTGQGLVVR